MIDRRLVTDFALAVLIALPVILPAAPSPWSLNMPAGYAAAPMSETAPDYVAVTTAGTSKWIRAQPERRS